MHHGGQADGCEQQRDADQSYNQCRSDSTAAMLLGPNTRKGVGE